MPSQCVYTRAHILHSVSYTHLEIITFMSFTPFINVLYLISFTVSVLCYRCNNRVHHKIRQTRQLWVTYYIHRAPLDSAISKVIRTYIIVLHTELQKVLFFLNTKCLTKGGLSRPKLACSAVQYQ